MSTNDTFIPPAEFVPLAAGVNVAVWRAQSAIILGSRYRYIADCLHLDAIPAEWMTEFTLSLTDDQRNEYSNINRNPIAAQQFRNANDIHEHRRQYLIDYNNNIFGFIFQNLTSAATRELVQSDPEWAATSAAFDWMKLYRLLFRVHTQHQQDATDEEKDRNLFLLSNIKMQGDKLANYNRDFLHQCNLCKAMGCSTTDKEYTVKYIKGLNAQYALLETEQMKLLNARNSATFPTSVAQAQVHIRTYIDNINSLRGALNNAPTSSTNLTSFPDTGTANAASIAPQGTNQPRHRSTKLPCRFHESDHSGGTHDCLKLRLYLQEHPEVAEAIKNFDIRGKSLHSKSADHKRARTSTRDRPARAASSRKDPHKSKRPRTYEATTDTDWKDDWDEHAGSGEDLSVDHDDQEEHH